MTGKLRAPARGYEAVLLALSVLLSQAAADIVTTVDGRTFEGIVLPSSYEEVIIDTVVARTRTTISLPRIDVFSVKRKKLAPDFFKKAEIAKPPSAEEKAGLYLEVPVSGRVGEDTVSDGLARVLRWAVGRSIQHVVLVFRTEGGDAREAWEMARLMAAYDGRIAFHGVVHKALGPQVACLLLCDDLFFVPGSTAGGGGSLLEEEVLPAGRYAPAFGALVKISASKGRHELLARALIDPRTQLAAWRSPSGEVKVAEDLPSGVPEERIVIRVDPHRTCTITARQADTLSLGKVFTGTIEELGQALDIPQWRSAGAYGKRTMLRAAQRRYQARIEARKQREARIREVREARNAACYAIEHFLELAEALDPERYLVETYRRHESRWEWYWGGDNLAPTVTRDRWRQLTDQAVWALLRARRAILTMQELELEAKSLGLKPLYKEGELPKLLAKTEAKLKALQYFRNRRTRSA